MDQIPLGVDVYRPALNLLIGETGVGKTSLINLLTDSNQKVGHGLEAGTKYPSLSYVDNWPIVDTRGLNDKDENAINEATDELRHFLFNGKYRLSSIILYIHDPLIVKRLKGDTVRALVSLKRMIANSHLDNIILLHRADLSKPKKIYDKAFHAWNRETSELGCVIREIIPVYGEEQYDDDDDVADLTIKNINEIKNALIKHKYAKYFGWRRATCVTCGKYLYQDFEIGPCVYHDTAVAHLGRKDFIHSGDLEVYHHGTWTEPRCFTDKWTCCG
ncbi:unnamed protein product, partial [Didymodactylos carnosus]